MGGEGSLQAWGFAPEGAPVEGGQEANGALIGGQFLLAFLLASLRCPPPRPNVPKLDWQRRNVYFAKLFICRHLQHRAHVAIASIAAEDSLWGIRGPCSHQRRCVRSTPAPPDHFRAGSESSGSRVRAGIFESRDVPRNERREGEQAL